MADARNDQEPSIEEILASIREIISDEDDTPAAQVAQSLPETQVEEDAADDVLDADDDILDLSVFAAEEEPEVEEVIEDVVEEEAPAAKIAFTEPLHVAREAEIVAAAPAPKPAAAPVKAPAAEPDLVASVTESLLTESAKAASLDSLTKLAQNIAISRSGNGNTIEDLVREMLRPMLREWLDSNLPPMIERMVERELERLVKQALDR